MSEYDPFRHQKRFALAALISLALALILLCALAARAQELPAGAVSSGQPRAGVSQRRFWILQSAAALSTAADCVSTNHLIQAGPQYRESNPLLGARPGPARIGATCGALFALSTASSFELRRTNHRRAWMIPPAVAIIAHGIAFGRNRSLYPRPGPALGWQGGAR